MKKIFSAFLLMTMMVFSVGSFVSCSDLENELAQVEGTANDNAAAIESLNSELAALKTALSAAQADADAAMAAAKAAKEAGDAAKAEAEAAKAAAEQAKAEAIAAVMAEVEAIQTAIAQNVEAITNLSGSVNANAVEIEALQEEIKALQTAAAEHVYAITNLDGTVKNHEMAIEDLETELSVLKNTLANYEKNLKDLGLLTDDFKEDIAQLTYAVTNLTTAVETNTNDIDGLKEQFEDVVAQVKTLNDSLIAIYDILGVLANQIQSVVFVPEYTTDVVYAQRVEVATGSYSNYFATATYEVRPAKLAESLTSENLSFASVNKKTKAANAPEYFKAQLLDADASTGRIVVRAVINDTDGANKTDCDYHKIDANGTVALSLNIASIDVTELLIAESNPDNVDMVSSEYVNVVKDTDLKLADVIGFAAKDADGKNVVNNEYKNYTSTKVNGIEMPWDKADSKKNLFDTEVAVLIAGEHLTLAEANELLGTKLEVKYNYTGEYINNFKPVFKEKVGTANEATIDTSKKASPIKVTGNTLAATAELVASDDYKEAASIGVRAIVSGKATVMNGTSVVENLDAEARYTIVNKKSDFEFADAKEVAWSYEDGDYAREIVQELAVVGFDKMDKDDPAWTFVATVGDDKYEATVKALSSKAVQVTIDEDELPYKQGEKAVYEFVGTVTYDKVDYTVVFNVTLGAMPADQVIDLGEIKTLGNTTANMDEDVDVMSRIRTIINAADNNFNKDYAYSKNNVAALNALFTASSDKVAENDGVWVNGVKTTSTSAAGYASFALNTVRNTDDEVLEEKSTININKVSQYENTITVVETYNVCGINFTVKAKVVTEEPQVGIAPNDFYVKDGAVDLDNGTVEIKYTTSKTDKSTESSTKYALETIDLRKYVHVTVPEGYEEDYQLLYTLETPMYKDDNTTPLYKNQVTSAVEIATIEHPSTKVVDNNGKPLANKLTWGVDLNSLTVKVALASATAKDADGKPVVFDSETITLNIPQLVTFTADQPVKVKYVPGQAAVANIAKAMKVVDHFENSIYNPWAADVTELFSGYRAVLDANGAEKNGATITNAQADFFNLYDQALVLPEADELEVYLDGVKKDLSMINYTFNEKGILTLAADNGKITGEVEFRINVGLRHLYDNYSKTGQTATVSVVFTKDAEVEEEGPAVDTEFAVPEGQFVGTIVGDATKTPYLFDFGTATVTAPSMGISITPDDNVFTISNMNMSDPDDTNFYFIGTEISKFEFVPTSAVSGVVNIQPLVDPTTNTWGVWNEGAYTYSEFTGTTLKFNLGGSIEFELTKVAADKVQATIGEISFGPAVPPLP